MTSTSYKTITEGSTTMVYPDEQESQVFYNPVQVQNRDLSTLMIALHVERRRRRSAVSEKKKDLRANQMKGDELQMALDLYDKDLDVSELIQSDCIGNNPSSASNRCRGIHIYDALAASGLRSIRYWKEIPGVEHVTINDLDTAAVERARDNVENNKLTNLLVSSRAFGIRIQHGNAMDGLYNSRQPPKQATNNASTTTTTTTPRALPFVEQEEQYDVIDLDPYGSAAPFLDGAVQAVTDGGMLNVTCTDMVALGGSHPETAFGRYGSLPIQRAPYLHEVAIRILLKSLAQSAAKYGRIIRPILSVGMDFYIRCFVEVYDDKAGIHDLSLNIGCVYQSTQCSSFLTVPHGQHAQNNRHVYQCSRAPSCCEETGAPFKVGGPIWLAPLHDQGVVREALARLNRKNKFGNNINGFNVNLLATRSRLEGLLTSVKEEVPDAPLYYSLPVLCHELNCQSPALAQMKAAIANAGYRVSGFHKEPQAIKTDAPNRVIWDVMRAWCKENPPKISKKKLKKMAKKQGAGTEDKVSLVDSTLVWKDSNKVDSAAEKILAIEPSIQVDFTIPRGGFHSNNRNKVTRFPMNPEKHWGPKKAASGKRKRNVDEETKLNVDRTTT